MSSYPNREGSFSRGKTKTDMGATIVRILAVSATLGAWSMLWVSLHGGLGPGADARADEACGKLMAQQTLALLEHGGQITVITRDTSTFKNPATDIQMGGFRKAIGKAHATISSLHELQVDPLRPIAVPSGDVCEAIKNTSKGSVIVSFMGPPLLTQAERARLGEIKPAIVAFCSGGLNQLVDLRTLFEQGLLRVAVVDCRGVERLAAGAVSRRDHPEQSFVTITAANVTDLSLWQGGER